MAGFLEEVRRSCPWSVRRRGGGSGWGARAMKDRKEGANRFLPFLQPEFGQWQIPSTYLESAQVGRPLPRWPGVFTGTLGLSQAAPSWLSLPGQPPWSCASLPVLGPCLGRVCVPVKTDALRVARPVLGGGPRWAPAPPVLAPGPPASLLRRALQFPASDSTPLLGVSPAGRGARTSVRRGQRPCAELGPSPDDA